MRHGGYKFKPKSWKTVVILITIIVASILITNFFGIGTQRSALRVGYVSHDGWHSWSANYTLLDGWLQHTIRPQSDILQIDVETESGAISIEMTGADGKVVFFESNIVTGSFEVEVPEKVVIKVEADHHKGGFSMQ